MKLGGAKLEAYLKAPDASYRAVLLFGSDLGLVKERAERIVVSIVPDRDPFRIEEFSAAALASDPARLEDEARALSLVPGRRVVRVREAGEAAAPLFERFLAAPPPGDTLVVVEAGELGYRSALRRAFEGAKAAAAVECNPDNEDEVKALARSVLGARKVALSEDALDYLGASLGGDRALSLRELEKLALYAGDGGKIGLEDARAVVGDSAGIGLEDTLFAAATGDAAQLERCLSRAYEEGEAPVRILRAAQMLFQRFYVATARMERGDNFMEAISGLRPPVLSNQRERFAAAARHWPSRRAAMALDALMDAERTAKHAGMPQDAICRDVLFRLARAAQRR